MFALLLTGQIMKKSQQIGSQTGEIMKNPKIFVCISLMFFLLLSACDLVQINPEETTLNSGTSTILITLPPDGSHLQTGQTVDIQSEVTTSSEASGVYLMVNGLTYYYDQFYQQTSDFHIYQPWTPQNPGEYTIHTIVEDNSGNKTESNKIKIFVDIDEDSLSGDVEEVVEEAEPIEEECPVPMATTSDYANCRSGPGTAYEIVEGLGLNQSFPIVGKSASGIWWQVERNDSGATCWVWADLVEICGNTDDAEVIGIQEKDEVIEEEVDEVIEEEVPEDPSEEPPEPPLPIPPAEFQACHDYPDFGICTSDPMGFGGCSWDTGQSQCVP